MATFSLRVAVSIRRYHVYKETWKTSLVDRVTLERHNGMRLPLYWRMYIPAKAAACNVYNFLLLGNHHDHFVVSAYEADGNDWSSRPKSESLKRPHSSSMEDASHTRVSGAIQVGLSGNLGEYNTSSIKIVSHRNVVSYNTHYTKKYMADYKLRYTVDAVRWEIITFCA